MATVKELQEEWEEASSDAENALIRRDNLKDQLRAAEADLTQALRKETEARFALRAKKEKV